MKSKSEKKHDKKTISKSPNLLVQIRKVLMSLLDRIRGNFFLARPLFKARKLVRSILEKYTIYVLVCSDGKYYVGSTQNKRQRFKEHMDPTGRASVWTDTHKPIRILKQYTRVKQQYALGLESKVTAEAMLLYGVNNVRGAMFAEAKPYTRQNIDSLTRFLGHYNNLSYADVRDRLQRTLPQSPTSKSKKKRKRNREKVLVSKDDRCFHCGQKGHWAYNCPGNIANNSTLFVGPPTSSSLNYQRDELPTINQNSKQLLPAYENEATVGRRDFNTTVRLKKSLIVSTKDRCFKCGERGHWAAECTNVKVPGGGS